MVSFSDVVSLVKQTGKEVGEDNCTSHSAAIAYFTLFSLPPLLVILVGVAGIVFGADAVQEQLTGQIGGLVGESGGEEIQTMIENAGDFGGGSVVGKILGVLALVFGATGAFGQLQQSLNRAWEVRLDPDAGGLMSFITKRVLSFGMVLTIAFFLVVSLGASALLAGMSSVVESSLGSAGAVAAWIGDIVLSLVLFTGLFAAIFKILPDVKIAWRDVWVGAFATAVLFVVGKYLIGLYLGNANPGEAFGAAGSVVVILVWLYYTALILLAGAEFTQVWASRYGSRIVPDEGAVRVVEDEKIVGHDGMVKEEKKKPDPKPVRREPPTPKDEAAPEVHPLAQPRDPQPRSGWNEEPPKEEEAKKK